MPHHHTTKTSVIPLSIGILLWAGATGLLLEEAIAHHKYDVATMATPVLTAATVAAACLAHLRFASFRLIGGTGFALLALLGSIVMATGTLGRLAEAKDSKEAGTQATNRTYGNKADDLKAAKVEQARECRSIGKKCEAWNARVDKLTSELSGIVVRSSDPKADAIARLATLLGFDGKWIKEVVAAFDPVLIPLFLELGSVGFFAAAFHPRKHEIVIEPERNVPETVTVAHPLHATVSQSEALRDIHQLGDVPAQSILAKRWRRDPSTVSRWLAEWHEQGLIDRKRIGRAKASSIVLALPAPCN